MFEDVQEEETEVPETETEEIEESTPDPLAEREADLAKREAGLKDWEKTLNTRSTELGLLSKNLQPAKDTPEPGLDDETAAELKKALKAVGADPDKFSELSALMQQTIDDAREDTFTSFLEAHPDADPEKLVAVVAESGISAEKLTPAALKRELNRAHKLIKADSIDPEAIAAEAREKLLKDLAAKGVKVDEITEVKKGRGAAAGSHKTSDDFLNDESVNPFEKLAFLGKSAE